eukprot:TRINITY_DN24138_c0_g1_i1.p1 TRINITY_DN24138_c0_g1~~TRINITY_DN24138_c0_g1_i1.p1  ORF type:complete len:186 (+),score=46.48 TRINITY_DN24138_c0_g1_i1:6-563(+)
MEGKQDAAFMNEDVERSIGSLHKMAVDYAKYFTYSSVTESEMATLAKGVKHMLTRLAEFNALLTTQIHGETSKSQDLMPILYAKAKQLEFIYATIDKLEQFLIHVEKTVQELDNKISQTERIYSEIESGSSSFGKMLGALKLKSEPEYTTLPQWEPVDVITHDQAVTLKSKLREEYLSNVQGRSK